MPRALLSIALCCLCLIPAAFADPDKRPQSIPELQQKLRTILKETNTPGLSVAIVARDPAAPNPATQDWTAAFGLANVAANQPATAQTLFRVGSISKGFASLAILKLVSEGKLSLLDPVRKLVPEIAFENRWEATDPVRVADLLEHTTGWDDIHFAEFAKDARNRTTRQGLDFLPASRISRWRPGTRMSYCNSGPAVAAYIVEKISGQPFEAYVTQNFFQPIGMASATYFEQPSPRLASLYQLDGKTPLPYWNFLFRPAGSLNASAEDMAAYLHFLLNRGIVSRNANGVQLLPAQFITRAETPTRTWEAQQGLLAGYGLGNYVTIEDGFVYHGHDGGVDGGVSQLAYLPDSGVGYFYSINTGNGDAFRRIGDAIRGYITRNLTRAPVPAVQPLPADAHDYEGWYMPATPRSAFVAGIQRLGVHRLRFINGNLEFLNLRGAIEQSYAPGSGNQYRLLLPNTAPQPIPTAMLIAPNAEGRFIHLTATWQQIPAWLVYTQLAVAAWFFLACAAVILYTPVWIIGNLRIGRRTSSHRALNSRPTERALRYLPLLAVLSLIATAILGNQALNSSNSLALLGSFTSTSFAIFLSSLVFGLASLASAAALAFALTRTPSNQPRKSLLFFSIAVILPLLAGAIYLAYWGLIGLRTWA